jgi:tetratricopeptide (TPR) repeat protein
VPHSPRPPTEAKQQLPKLSPAKRIIFWLFLMLLPVVIIVACEFALRAFDYGDDLRLVERTRKGGKDYYTLNLEVAKRYFSQKGIAIPTAYDDLFEVHKQPNTKRIFMLGESTMAGFPYIYTAIPSHLLKVRLQQLLPQYNIEVINVGLAAVNSYTVLDFINELVDYQPDAFVVYLGHNEFYGALGIGSTEYLGKSRTLVTLYVKLHSYKTFQLMRNVIASAKAMISPPVNPKQATLMGNMVGKKAIPFGSDDYNIARENFRGNLEDIVSVAGDHHVPIVLSTLTSNTRGQKPLIDVFSPQTSDEAKGRWQDIFSVGTNAADSAHYDKAIGLFAKCIAIDSLNAKAHFAMAQCYDSLKDYNHARHEYEIARDFDGLRFRATGEFSDIIRQVCEERHCALSEAEHAFEDASPHGMVGYNLILEHLHPNVEGYRLLAKTFLQAIATNNLIAPKDEWNWSRDLSDSGYARISGVTRFDSDAGDYRIAVLTHAWPFTDSYSTKIAFPETSEASRLAVEYAQKKLDWSEAKYKLADYYQTRGQYNLAIDENFSLSQIMFYSYVPFLHMGDEYRMLNKPDSAEMCYRRGLQVLDSPYLHVRLGMLNFERDSLNASIKEFEQTFTTEDTGSERMDTKARSMAHYLLANAYGKAGNRAKAESEVTIATQIDPGNKDAAALLRQLHAQR